MAKDLIGQRFGRLVVLKFSHMRDYPEGGKIRKRSVYTCQCDCGEIKDIPGIQLGKGTESCGCLGREVAVAKLKKLSLPVGEASLNKLYATYQTQARNRKLDFNLSKIQFLKLVSSNCIYCGIAPSQLAGDSTFNGRALYNGIDRVDNTRGYEIDNCVSCCDMCNHAKKDYSVEQFFSWIKRLSTFQSLT